MMTLCSFKEDTSVTPDPLMTLKNILPTEFVSLFKGANQL